MSAWTCHSDGKAAAKIVPPHLRIPSWKGLGADSEEKHEPVSDIYTAAADSLKALDPERPIREAGTWAAFTITVTPFSRTTSWLQSKLASFTRGKAQPDIGCSR